MAPFNRFLKIEETEPKNVDDRLRSLWSREIKFFGPISGIDIELMLRHLAEHARGQEPKYSPRLTRMCLVIFLANLITVASETFEGLATTTFGSSSVGNFLTYNITNRQVTPDQQTAPWRYQNFHHAFLTGAARFAPKILKSAAGSGGGSDVVTPAGSFFNAGQGLSGGLFFGALPASG